jgi:hypothetical protein
MAWSRVNIARGSVDVKKPATIISVLVKTAGRVSFGGPHDWFDPCPNVAMASLGIVATLGSFVS